MSCENGYVKMMRTDDSDELFFGHPNAYLLLTLIARRAKRRNCYNRHNLKVGEAIIGDYKRLGLTERQYRDAKQVLQSGGFATFRPTNKGTIACIADTRVYDINREQKDGQTTDKGTDRGRTDDGQRDRQRTTNEEWKNGRREEWKKEEAPHSPPEGGVSHQPSNDSVPEANGAVKKSRKRRRDIKPCPPTREEVRQHCAEKGFTRQQADKFFDHYDAAGWYQKNGNPIQNWKSVMENNWADGWREQNNRKEQKPWWLVPPTEEEKAESKRYHDEFFAMLERKRLENEET